MAKMLFCDVRICLSTMMKPFLSVFILMFSSPMFLLLGLLPTTTRILSASIFFGWPASSMLM